MADDCKKLLTLMTDPRDAGAELPPGPQLDAGAGQDVRGD